MSGRHTAVSHWARRAVPSCVLQIQEHLDRRSGHTIFFYRLLMCFLPKVSVAGVRHLLPSRSTGCAKATPKEPEGREAGR